MISLNHEPSLASHSPSEMFARAVGWLPGLLCSAKPEQRVNRTCGQRQRARRFRQGSLPRGSVSHFPCPSLIYHFTEHWTYSSQVWKSSRFLPKKAVRGNISPLAMTWYYELLPLPDDLWKHASPRLTSSNTHAEPYALPVCPKPSRSAVCCFCKEHHHLLAHYEIPLLLAKTQNGNKRGLFDQSKMLRKCKALAC